MLGCGGLGWIDGDWWSGGDGGLMTYPMIRSTWIHVLWLLWLLWLILVL